MLPFAELKRGQAEGKTVEAAKRPSVRDIVNLLRIPEYLLVVLGYTAYTFALGAFAIWGPSFCIAPTARRWTRRTCFSARCS
jgi:hypothetical protein